MHPLRPTSGLLLVGHGTRHEEGQAEFRTIASKVAAALAPEPDKAREIALEIGADANLVDNDWGAIENWHAVLAAAERLQRVDVLLKAIGKKFHVSDELQEAMRDYEVMTR